MEACLLKITSKTDEPYVEDGRIGETRLFADMSTARAYLVRTIPAVLGYAVCVSDNFDIYDWDRMNVSICKMPIHGSANDGYGSITEIDD